MCDHTFSLAIGELLITDTTAEGELVQTCTQCGLEHSLPILGGGYAPNTTENPNCAHLGIRSQLRPGTEIVDSRVPLVLRCPDCGAALDAEVTLGDPVIIDANNWRRAATGNPSHMILLPANVQVGFLYLGRPAPAVGVRVWVAGAFLGSRRVPLAGASQDPVGWLNQVTSDFLAKRGKRAPGELLDWVCHADLPPTS